MRKIIFLFLLLAAALPALAQSTEHKSIRQVKTIMEAQKIAWNKGDISTFMAAYWNSPKLQFIGATGVTEGWEATMKRYQSTYPDKASMGQLEFEINQTELRSKKVVTMTGKYILTRDNKNLVGYFLLVWEKKGKNWVIVMDATT